MGAVRPRPRRRPAVRPRGGGGADGARRARGDRASAATRARRAPAACTSWCPSRRGTRSTTSACSRGWSARGSCGVRPDLVTVEREVKRRGPAGVPRPPPERPGPQHRGRLLGAPAAGGAGRDAAALGRGAAGARPARVHDGRRRAAGGARGRPGRRPADRPPGAGRAARRASAPGEGAPPRRSPRCCSRSPAAASGTPPPADGAAAPGERHRLLRRLAATASARRSTCWATTRSRASVERRPGGGGRPDRRPPGRRHRLDRQRDPVRVRRAAASSRSSRAAAP